MEDVRDQFAARYGVAPTLVFAPGRVNLIGEHTDYHEGFVLPMALQLGTMVGIAPRSGNTLRITSLSRDEEVSVSLMDPASKQRGLWIDYVEGIVRALQRRGVHLVGADLVIASDLPEGAGLSSSAALVTAVGLSLCEVSGVAIDRTELALAAQEAEHVNVGTKCGIMDQLVSGQAREGTALFIDCRSLRVQPVTLPATLAVIVFDTGVKHELVSSAYNQRRSECEEGLRIVRQRLHDVSALRDVTLEQLSHCAVDMPEVTYRRCRHVVSENDRVCLFVRSLEMGNGPQLGRLMVASHRSLRDDYEVSCAELDILVDAACAHPATVGARMTGGGFGGCVIALVQEGAQEEVIGATQRAFAARFGRTPPAHRCWPGQGAHVVHRVEKRERNQQS